MANKQIHRGSILALIFVVSLVASLVFAQQATTTATTATATTTAQDEQAALEQNLEDILQERPASEQYRYDSQGRRDPFKSLISGKTRGPGDAERPPGLPGFLVDEIDLTGVVRTKAGLVAMISGPDNKGYLLKVGDKIYDGEVVRITPTAIEFRQEVNDPVSIERFKIVSKELTPQAAKTP